MLTWVIGAGGLLGQAVARTAEHVFTGPAVPWTDPATAGEVLESGLSRFASEAGPGAWSLVWAAGSGVVGSSQPALDAETNVVARFARALRRQRPDGDGAFFLASSAGAVYAGSREPPFNELTTPRPLSQYGRAKLRQEHVVTQILGGTVPVAVGRLSNLYGPGQNLAKSQGLVSQACLAAARRQPVNVFVPMDTLRDYLYVEDAATMVDTLVGRTLRDQPETPIMRVLASERPTSVAAVLRTVLQIARRPVRIGLGRAPTADQHVHDLRVTSCFTDQAAPTPITPLPVGIKRVYEHILSILRHQPSTIP
jgi:UDP-glucose 4-epimerase